MGSPGPLLHLALIAALTASCGGGSPACTEIGCENTASVGYGTLVSGPYDLVILAEGETVTARCNDPDALETADNPDNLKCNASGFEVDGGSLARASSMFVSVVDLTTDEPVFENAEVIMSVVGELTPNGPDCDPICTERSGTIPPPP